MTTDPTTLAEQPTGQPLRWAWVVAGTALGAILLTVFIRLVDPGLQEPGVDALLLTLSLLLTGVLVGRRSAGKTIREAALAGFVLLLLATALTTALMGVRVPALVWAAGPFYAALVAMLGGYVGELLQGTLEEAYVDRAVDWPWVVVALVIGFTVASCTVFLLRAWVSTSPALALMAFAASFFVTGFFVAYSSPGITMVEPAIASALMTVLFAGFIFVWIDPPPSVEAIAGSFLAGIFLGVSGGWLGETLQKARLRE